MTTAKVGGRKQADNVDRLPALKPLALALLGVFPAAAWSAPPAVRLPTAPSPATVPRPLPGWRVYGTGALAPVNKGNAAGGTDQTITQTSTRGIYNWQSFDIGAASSVTFNFNTADSSALNRVLGANTPSQIFGTLRSQVLGADPSKAPTVGGSLFLINANGIVFGKTAQVNTGALIASTLDLSNADYQTGFAQSLASADPTFTYQGAPELFTDSSNFVLVQQGAQITTASGGRVFLFAKNVQNGGSISTPDGQTVLAAGSAVDLNNPTAEPLYASEVNPDYPALRGLLVEVGQANGVTGQGTTSNLAGGSIDTARGNTTMVGMAVNQLGRVSATTSVSANGSVFLLARGDAAGATAATGGGTVKHATIGGTLTLGPESSIAIDPDTTVDAKGNQAATNASSVFTASRVELSGQTIELQSGASIVAHGGIVDARAETTPYYQSGRLDVNDPAALAADDSVRLVLGDHATIDVSGTTTTTVSAARNFVTTELLGKSDLKDAPLQKDGPLYRSKVTFDLRAPVPILGDTSAYKNAVLRTATEDLAKGGSIDLSSSGALVTAPTSTLNIAGGLVNYTDATVFPTRLVSADGAHYTLNAAPADTVYTRLEAASTTATQDRWGIVPQYLPAQALTGQAEKGYVDGQAGGALNVAAPRTVLDGQLHAAVVDGARQTAGQDAHAALAGIALGLRNNDSQTQTIAFGQTGFQSAVLRDLDIDAVAGALPAGFWDAPLTNAVPATGRIAAATLDASGVGRITISADGDVALKAGADLTLPTGGAVDVAVGGAGGVVLAAGIHAEGGSVSVKTRLVGTNDVGPGGITLGAGKALDVSGDFVNRALDGALADAATAGGTVTLSSANALLLQDASRIDVSGGATVSTAGVVRGTAGGSITLEGNAQFKPGDAPAQVHIGSSLLGQSLTTGGTLAMHGADTVSIVDAALPRGVADGAAPGSLVLTDAFFRNGAFTGYDVQALSSVTVQPGTVVLLQARNGQVTLSDASMPSGTRLSTFTDQGLLPDAQRAPVHLALGAGSAALGDVTIGAGSLIQTDPLGAVQIAAGLDVDVQGRIVAPGGRVDVRLADGAVSTDPATSATGLLHIGPAAVIDVSGTTVRQVQTGLLPLGTVLPGGTVEIDTSPLAARATPVQIDSGAVIAADGASARLGVPTTLAAGGTTVLAQTVNSAGGRIGIVAREGGAVIAGDLHAHGGGGGDPTSAASAGSFTLSLAGVRVLSAEPPINLVPDYTVVVRQGPVAQTAPVAGAVQLSAQQLAAGFANVGLTALDHIRFNGDVDLNIAGNLALDAPLISASTASRTVSLTAGGSLVTGHVPDLDHAVSTTPLAGRTTLTLAGGLIEFQGEQGLQGFGKVTASASSEIRFNGVQQGATQRGNLALQADLTLSAPQISPTSNSTYSIDAPGQTVLLTGGDKAAPAVLSAGGTLTVNAADISTVNPADAAAYGVLRAPFGSLALNATDRIDIGAGSLLSVSGAGMTVPFGATVNGKNWSYANLPVTAPVAKTVALNAPGQSVAVAAGSTIDASGGGALLASEFVAGPGGSTDVFAGAAGGAYAVVPGITGYAPQDADLLALRDAGGALASTQLGARITIGTGAPIAAGTYTLLPARYALLPGAFLVQPVASAAPLAMDAAVAQRNGSVIVGARFGTAGDAPAASLTSSVRVLTSTQARAYSQIDQTDANAYFAGVALAAGTPVPALPQDAGRVDIAAGQLALKGSTLFALQRTTDGTGATSTVGRGGELDVAADRILVGHGQTAPDTRTLVLETADLNATGAATLVIGARRGGADGTALQVGATQVDVDNAGQTLKAGDIVLAATNRVELHAGAGLQAVGDGGTGSGAGTAPQLTLSGDGALLRVSSDVNASSVRTDVLRLAGDLAVDAGASVQGAALTAEATHANTIAADARLVASSVTLGANRIAVGAADPAQLDPTTLLLAPALAAQLDGSSALTLRSFAGINLYGAATLGSAALRSLTLDTGRITVVDAGAQATVSAGNVRLTNTSGADSTLGTGSNTGTGTGTGTGSIANPATGTGAGDAAAAGANANSGSLRLVAAGSTGAAGDVVVGPGSMAVGGVAQLTVQASGNVVVSGKTALAASGDISIDGNTLQAAQGAEASFATPGTFTLNATGATPAGNGGTGSTATTTASASTSASTTSAASTTGSSTATASAPAVPGAGAHVAIDAAGIVQAGRIALPSGELRLTASGAAAANTIEFTAASRTDLAGRSTTIDGVVIGSSGGDLHADAAAGNVRLDAGAVVDVSAPGGANGSAGSVRLAAPAGSITIGGALRGAAAGAQGGGTLALDSAMPVDLEALQATLAATPSNFTGAIDVRNRSGDQLLGAGAGLHARQITIGSDSGALTVTGVVAAEGENGGSAPTITLAAGGTLRVADGADIGAHGTGTVGGQVQLMAGTAAVQNDGSLLGNGQIQLDGGRIDTSGASGNGSGSGTAGTSGTTSGAVTGVDGSVLLRAQRTPDGVDVRIGKAAGASGTTVMGAHGVEVEAVKQYLTAQIDGALIAQVNADDQAFAGPRGSQAAAVTARVGALFNPASTAPVPQLRAGVEVLQSDPGTDLVVSGSSAVGGWNLTSFDALGNAMRQPTGAPVNLTIRAAGNLDVQASISDGYLPAGATPANARSAVVIKPVAVVAQVDGVPLAGGRIRLVGGADLSAADPMATTASADSGDVTIGADNANVIVRSTSGDIQIAAGRDVKLLNGQAAVYTTGLPVAQTPGYVGDAALSRLVLKAGTVSQSPFLSGGGSVSVQAARDVVGAGDTDAQYATDWLWRAGDQRSATAAQPVWWSRYDLFRQGIATFGGGNVTVAAGRDAVNVEASAAASGYIARDAAGNTAGAQRYGGGNVALQAQRDVIGGFVLNDMGALTVESGRNIATPGGQAALQALYGNSAIDIEARDSAQIGAVAAWGLVPATKQGGGNNNPIYLTGLAAQASLRAVANAGDLQLQAQPSIGRADGVTAGHDPGGSLADLIVPDIASFAAPAGSVTIDTLIQAPGGTSRLDVLAAANTTVSTLAVNGSTPVQTAPGSINNPLQTSALTAVFAPGATPFDNGVRTPVRIVAQTGDVTIATEMDIAKSLRLIAGRDVVLGPDTFFGTLQHQSADESSLIEAGRDVVFANESRTAATLKVYGPGNVDVVAGRNVNLQISGGIGALGNRENAALPAAGAAVNVMAGVSLGGADYRQAIAFGMPLLGGTGIAGFAPDLLAQLTALQANPADTSINTNTDTSTNVVLPALGSAAATAYAALSAADQLVAAQKAAGSTAFNTAVLADARRRQTDGTVTMDAATAAFAKLPDADRLAVANTALAQAWLAAVPVTQQAMQLSAMLAVAGRGTADALSAYVATQTGKPVIGDPLAALATFDALPIEQQAVFVNQTLVGAIRTAGRTASALAGSARDAAYQHAYDALALVFPDAGTAGDLAMGSSQLRTYQDSPISVLTPRGGVNVGDLVAGPNPKSAAALGIVTGAGGDISVVVRDNVEVNQSRVFTVAQGDLLMWASLGNLDAGRGAKTVTSAPPPLYRIDGQGNFVIDTSASFTGSGIAVLDAGSTLDLYAPKGEINAGDAGIKSLGNAYLGAARFVGADNLSISGVAVGAPPPASTGGETAGLAVVGQSATSAGLRINPEDTDDEKDRKRRKRINLVLDFLGFGDGTGEKP